MQNVCLLGATGSVGKSALEVLALYPEKFRLFSVAAHSNVQKLADIAVRFNVRRVGIADVAKTDELARLLKEAGRGDIEILSGPEAAVKLAADKEAQTVIVAVVGAAGVPATFAAAKAGKRILHANKESVVCGGAFLQQTVRENGAVIVNNADWLLNLNYIDFLREVGALFSVNRMLTAECYKRRLETGLTFLEFNYMLMQSYDFLQLFQKYNCRLQIGGDDQWSNMLSGADLIRRKEQQDAFALTCKLIMTHDGKKMGKTEKGALWLDPARTSPYEFYQYWRNVADADVERFLGLLTFLPMDEVRRLGALKDAQINEAKRVLAFEITKLVHGEEEAMKAQNAAQALFAGGGSSENVPTYEVNAAMLAEDSRLTSLLAMCGLCASRGEARKMVQAGAVLVGENKVTDIDACIDASQIGTDGLLLRKGKKNYCRLILK